MDELEKMTGEEEDPEGPVGRLLLKIHMEEFPREQLNFSICTRCCEGVWEIMLDATVVFEERWDIHHLYYQRTAEGDYLLNLESTIREFFEASVAAIREIEQRQVENDMRKLAITSP